MPSSARKVGVVLGVIVLGACGGAETIGPRLEGRLPAREWQCDEWGNCGWGEDVFEDGGETCDPRFDTSDPRCRSRPISDTIQVHVNEAISVIAQQCPALADSIHLFWSERNIHFTVGGPDADPDNALTVHDRTSDGAEVGHKIFIADDYTTNYKENPYMYEDRTNLATRLVHEIRHSHYHAWHPREEYEATDPWRIERQIEFDMAVAACLP
jgi:hypothetical protein